MLGVDIETTAETSALIILSFLSQSPAETLSLIELTHLPQAGAQSRCWLSCISEEISIFKELLESSL